MLDIISTGKTLESQESENCENEDDEYENEDEDYKNESEDDDETIDLNKIIKEKKWLFRWNNWQIKIIWRSNKII